MCHKHTFVRAEDKANKRVLMRTHDSQVQGLTPDPIDKILPVNQFPILNHGAPLYLLDLLIQSFWHWENKF